MARRYNQGEVATRSLLPLLRSRSFITFINIPDRNGLPRTGREAGRTARTARRVHHRQWNSADPRHETNGAGQAIVATNPAFDLLGRQTALANRRAQRPRRLCRRALQGAGAAGVYTGGTESAFANGKINDRIAAIAVADDVCWTDRQAISAARAGLQKKVFGERPRRPQRSRGTRESTTEKIAAANRVGHGSSPAASARSASRCTGARRVVAAAPPLPGAPTGS
jgi:hypothetical protein